MGPEHVLALLAALNVITLKHAKFIWSDIRARKVPRNFDTAYRQFTRASAYFLSEFADVPEEECPPDSTPSEEPSTP